MGKVNAGSKKIVKNYKPGKNGGVQFCIDAHLMSEVVNTLKKLKGVTVLFARIEVGTPFSCKRVSVPNKLRKIGLGCLRQSTETYRGEITFDQCTLASMCRNVKQICDELHLDYDKASVRYITLTNGKGTGRFERTKKEIRPDETDLRKKATVLGLAYGEGQVQSLIADINADKFMCGVEEITVKVYTCSKA